MEKYGGKRYYRIRVPVFWLLVICVVLLFFGIYFKDELHKKWLHSGGMEDVTFQGLTSKLEDQGNCYLCGSSDYSLVDVFRKSGRIGVILLNDWYVLEFHIKSRDESVPSAEEGYRTFTSGNTGEITYSSEGSYSGQMASIEVTLPEDFRLKTDVMENNLCQSCLDKVAESLDFRKWKYEKKEAIPLCLVDFETLEIYSLQDWHVGCLIRDYWAEMEHEGNKVSVDVYDVGESWLFPRNVSIFVRTVFSSFS